MNIKKYFGLSLIITYVLVLLVISFMDLGRVCPLMEGAGCPTAIQNLLASLFSRDISNAFWIYALAYFILSFAIALTINALFLFLSNIGNKEKLIIEKKSSIV